MIELLSFTKKLATKRDSDRKQELQNFGSAKKTSCLFQQPKKKGVVGTSLDTLDSEGSPGGVAVAKTANDQQPKLPPWSATPAKRADCPVGSVDTVLGAASERLPQKKKQQLLGGSSHLVCG